MRVFLINGPPASGKDTFGEILAKQLGGRTAVVKFAHALKVATHAAVSLLAGVTKIPGPHDFEGRKDEALPEFFGVTPRDAYIQMSEKFAKPLFGEGFFGEVLAARIKNMHEQVGIENFVVTDCGFQDEVEVLRDSFMGADFVMVQVLRTGATYDGDSRGDVRIDGIPTYLVENNGDLKSLRDQAIHIADSTEEVPV